MKRGDDIEAELARMTAGMPDAMADATRAYVRAIVRGAAEDDPAVTRLASELLVGCMAALNGSPKTADRMVAFAVAQNVEADGDVARFMVGTLIAAYYAGYDSGRMAGILASVGSDDDA